MSKRRSRRSLRLVVFSIFVTGLVGSVVVFWFAKESGALASARSAYLHSDYRLALATARRYLKDHPDDRAATLIVARSLHRLGRFEEAERYYQNRGPLAPDDLQDRGYGLIQCNQPQAAAEIYDELLEKRPTDALALKRLGAVRLGLKQWSRALAVSDRLIQIPNEEVSGRTMAGIAQHELKHYQQAVDANLRVLELDPELTLMPLPRTLFWTNLAMDLMALGEDDRARAFLQRGEAGSKNAALMELIGLTYSQQGKIDDAERCWRQAESWDPNNADVCLDLGRLALTRKKWDEAVAFLKRAADESTDAVEPLYNLSQAYRMLGNHAEAQRYKSLADHRRTVQPKPASGMGSDTEAMTAEAAVRTGASSP